MSSGLRQTLRMSRRASDAVSPLRVCRQKTHGFLCCQRFEAGDHIEQFLVDSTLAQTVKGAVESFQQFVDVLVGSFHGGQAARILACERFGACPEERNEKIFADECSQSRLGMHDFGLVPGRPANLSQTQLPGRVERE
jgi:hypothetical protein